MRPQAGRRARKIAALLLTLALTLGVGSGCTKSKNSETPAQATIPVGVSRPVYAFDAQRAQSITLAKTDPLSGDHWMTRVERRQEKPTTFYENDPWIIQSYSETAELRDRLANRGFFLHLLDTLTTLHATAAVADGDSEAVRASYGLNPPRYALSWRTPEKEFQVEVGSSVDPTHPASKESFGRFPPSKTIYKIDGAAIAMLDYIKGFSTLRQEVLSPLTSDDVDEIEIYLGQKKVFYAQRDGQFWTRENHTPWKKDVQAFLDRMTHLRIQAFVDQGDAKALALQTEIQKHPLSRLILKDRSAHPTEFIFARIHGRELALVPARSTAIFELYPGALKQLQP